MSFPLIYCLIPYGILILAGAIFIFFNVMHLLVFGLQSFKTALVILLYLAATGAVIIYSYMLISAYNWSGDVMLSDILSPFLSSIL